MQEALKKIHESFGPPPEIRQHRTRISDLDALLNGGYPEGRMTLIEGVDDKKTWDEVWWTFYSKYDSDDSEFWYDLKEDGNKILRSKRPRVAFMPDIYFGRDPKSLDVLRFLGSLMPHLRTWCTTRNIALVVFSHCPTYSKALRYYASVRLRCQKTDIGFETKILKSTVSAGMGLSIQHG